MKLFQVQYSSGVPFVAYRELIEKRGSWLILRSADGTVEKVNGYTFWHQGMMDAIIFESRIIMRRAVNRHDVRSFYTYTSQLSNLIVEAYEVGRLSLTDSE